MGRRRFTPIGETELTYDDTGEVANRNRLTVTSSEGIQFGNRWYFMSQDADEALAIKGRDLGLDGIRVLLYLRSIMEHENAIHVSQKVVCDKLGIHKSNVSKTMKRLVDLGYLSPGPETAGRGAFRLSPTIAWRGNGSAHRRALRERKREATVMEAV
jgi:DNA-binding MarR family transcriptional regulator